MGTHKKVGIMGRRKYTKKDSSQGERPRRSYSQDRVQRKIKNLTNTLSALPVRSEDESSSDDSASEIPWAWRTKREDKRKLAKKVEDLVNLINSPHETSTRPKPRKRKSKRKSDDKSQHSPSTSRPRSCSRKRHE